MIEVALAIVLPLGYGGLVGWLWAQCLIELRKLGCSCD